MFLQCLLEMILDLPLEYISDEKKSRVSTLQFPHFDVLTETPSVFPSCWLGVFFPAIISTCLENEDTSALHKTRISLHWIQRYLKNTSHLEDFERLIALPSSSTYLTTATEYFSLLEDHLVKMHSKETLNS